MWSLKRLRLSVWVPPRYEVPHTRHVLADLGGRVPKHSLPCLRVPLASAAACSIVCSRISPTDDVNLSPEMVRANWTRFYTTYGGPLFGRGGQVRYVKANATA